MERPKSLVSYFVTWLLSNMKFKFEELRIYQEAIDFVSYIFGLTKKWQSPYKFSLGDQLQRAALSVPLNIAEGSGKTSKDFQHFLSIARGSCYECVAILTVAKKEHLVAEAEFLRVYDRIYIIAKTITALKSSISSTK